MKSQNAKQHNQLNSANGPLHWTLPTQAHIAYFCQMKSRARKNPRLLFVLMAIYIFAQFVWWANLLIRYNPEKKLMVLGEGAVFLILLGLGIVTIYRTIRHEIDLARMQKNFLLSITHELKTPVAAGKLFLQTLIKHNFDKEKQTELLLKSIKENDRLAALIDKVLMATTLDSSALPIMRIEQSLTELADRVCRAFAESIGQQHKWKFEIEPTVQANFDSESMQSVMENLLENAVKYSPKESLIVVSLTSTAQHIKFCVADNGPGIARVDLPFIFDKFYRSGQEDTRSAKGTGLGLFIVKHLVGLHNGTVRYEANAPHGSKFIVELNPN